MAPNQQTVIKYRQPIPYIEGRDPSRPPNCYLVREGENSYRIESGRRKSNCLLVNKLRDEVEKWRNNDYPGVSPTTRELLHFWFFNDHQVNGELFRYWYCQREAVETLIYLYEVKKYDDLVPVIKRYAENFKVDLFKNAVEIVEDVEGRRKIIRYFPELEQQGEQEIPEKGLLRYAFKMATGSGKTYAMALIIVWSYFNRVIEKNNRFPDNFLIIAPNVIVYERLAKDFVNEPIFYNLPLIPGYLRNRWNIEITYRDDNSPLNPSGNLIINNIQQLYASRSEDWRPENIVDDILGRKPQKDLTKSPELILDKIKKLDNLMVINDEAHHVHDVDLQWHKTLMDIHNKLPEGINLWLDFSATPKDQNGTYYPWIIVDYPLAQAVEDRIVKVPLIVRNINRKDPEDITKENVVRKYSDWITAAIERWKEHYDRYSEVGKKPVLFIMCEKNEYCDRIAEAIKKHYKGGILKKPDDEVLVIHVKSRDGDSSETEIRISERDLPKLRELARKIDEPDSKIKIIVSNLMLREGWDVQNVTIALGLRPFTSKARILPEQAVGRGLRIMKGIGPDHTQTLEVMGTRAFEEFVKELEKEGVGIDTPPTPPPLPVIISPEKQRLKYDIEIPELEFRYQKKYKNLERFDPENLKPIFASEKLKNPNRIRIKIEEFFTQTEIDLKEIQSAGLSSGHELCIQLVRSIEKRARLCSCFDILYPKVEHYLLNICFDKKIESIEDGRLRMALSDLDIPEAITEYLAKEIGNLVAESRKEIKETSVLKLSKAEPFTWRRKHIRCNKTVFNFVAVYNDFEAEFARFLDAAPDIEKFSALASLFKIDYLSKKGCVRFYYPDFVAVQKIGKYRVNWIIETKGLEYEDTDRKDEAIKKWCKDATRNTGEKWRYLKVIQSEFNKLSLGNFEDLLNKLRFPELK